MDSEKNFSLISDKWLFLKIFQTFHMAIQPNKLFIALSALIVIFIAGWLMDFSNTVVTDDNGQTELQVYLTSNGQFEQFIQENKHQATRQGVFATLINLAFDKFHASIKSLLELDFASIAVNAAQFFHGLLWAIKHHFIYCLIFFIIKLAVISIAGGSLCRITALQFARGEKPGLIESLRFSISRFSSFFAAPLVPVGIIIFIGLFLFCIGLLGNIPVLGEIIVAVSIPLALLAGAFISAVAIGAVAGFNLMFPAAAYDGSDCFDSISRAFSYIYTRPWRMALYSFVAACYGSICYLVIRLFAFLLLLSTHMFLRLGIFSNAANGDNKLDALWSAPRFMDLTMNFQTTTLGWIGTFASAWIHLFVLLVVGLVGAFIISFYFSANTIIYSLMRYKVDDTALDDVYMAMNHNHISAAEPKTINNV